MYSTSEIRRMEGCESWSTPNTSRTQGDYRGAFDVPITQYEADGFSNWPVRRSTTDQRDALSAPEALRSTEVRAGDLSRLASRGDTAEAQSAARMLLDLHRSSADRHSRAAWCAIMKELCI